MVPAAVLALGGGCSSILDVDPTRYVAEDVAIVDGASARAALAGAYDALQSVNYYAEPIISLAELASDNMEWTGTFTSYRQFDRNQLLTTNSQVEATWNDIYEGINRANVVIQKVPEVAPISDEEKNRIVGEALFLRALHYHNLVKFWGGVPIRTEPFASIDDASQITRATVAEVYTQILADLQLAETLIPANQETRAASRGAVRALRARVMLYQASDGPTGTNSADWVAVLAAAGASIADGYTLAPNYPDLFHRTGANTSEDIFRVRFVPEDAFWGGYYFLVEDLGGRYEVGPTISLETAYEAGDARGAWSIQTGANGLVYASKYPTPVGAEHPHVIRLAEVILIQAEALARLNRYAEAVDAYNRLRVRAGLAAHVLGVDVLADQASVLAAIDRERRVELAFEGDRWPDLVRSSRAVATVPIPASRAYQVLWPIPQSEIDVTRNTDGTPRLIQNPGY
jgi:starch-binding outer membrane protein, SusD/RagB family